MPFLPITVSINRAASALAWLARTDLTEGQRTYWTRIALIHMNATIDYKI